MVRAFQSATQALAVAEIPVVAAPRAGDRRRLRGSCMHADRVQAAAESYHRSGRGRRRPHSRRAAARRNCWPAAVRDAAGGHADLLPFAQPVFGDDRVCEGVDERC